MPLSCPILDGSAAMGHSPGGSEMAVRLTDRKVAALSATKVRAEVFDREPGLLIRVSPEGRKTWFLRYRTADGRQPRYKLGTFPATGVKDARERAQAARRVLEAGQDPAALERRSKAEAKAQIIRSFDDLVQAYFVACEAAVWTPRGRPKRASTIRGEREVYQRHVKPVLGHRLISELGRTDVRTLVRGMLARGIGAKTNQAHALVRQVFGFAIAEELASENPAVGVTAAPKKVRERILTGVELRKLWEALESPFDLLEPNGRRVYIGRPLAIALQLTALLIQRRQDIAGIRIEELDLERGLWTIPAARFKSGRPHVVPLPPKSVELMQEAIDFQVDPIFLFPAAGSAKGSMHPDSLTHAMGKLSSALEFGSRAAPHDLRRTGATRMSAEGVAPFIVSQVLGHASDGGGGSMVTRAHYNLHHYTKEKRQALCLWETMLLEIVGQQPPNDGIVPAGRVSPAECEV